MYGQDDESLWLAFKKGERSAFEVVYETNVQQLISYGYKITSDRNVIQDCTQDLFVELWENRERLSDVRSIKYYLLKSLRYKIVRHLRTNVVSSFEEAQFEVEDNSPEFQLLYDEHSSIQTRHLLAALGQLPKRQQEAIHLRYFLNMTNDEMARIMGVNYQSACKFLYTALKNLRQTLHLKSLGPLLLALTRFF
jgi:RNA polymerase sigma factor (sigma-70 family)